MSDDGPGAALLAFVVAAVGDDFATPADAVTVVERGDDPGPAARLSALVGRIDGGDDGDDSGGGGEGDDGSDDERDDADGHGETAIVGVVPRIDPSLVRRASGDLPAEARLVFTGRAAERLDGLAGTAVRSALDAHDVTPYRHDGDSPVAVFLVGERAVVGLFDERGLAAVLCSDATPVRRWAAETCRRFLAAAAPV